MYMFMYVLCMFMDVYALLIGSRGFYAHVTAPRRYYTILTIRAGSLENMAARLADHRKTCYIDYNYIF